MKLEPHIILKLLRQHEKAATYLKAFFVRHSSGYENVERKSFYVCCRTKTLLSMLYDECRRKKLLSMLYDECRTKKAFKYVAERKKLLKYAVWWVSEEKSF